jgi:hypothetical protein
MILTPNFGLATVAENFARLWNSLRVSTEALADAHFVLYETARCSESAGVEGTVVVPFEHNAIASCACPTAKAYREAREIIKTIRMGTG